MTSEEIQVLYHAARARLGASSPEPPPSRRLVDLFLAPFGRDSRSYARAERARLIEAAARREVADRLAREGMAHDAAARAIEAALGRG